jgi:hypothetical protein
VQYKSDWIADVLTYMHGEERIDVVREAETK